MSFSSKDRELVEIFCRCAKVGAKIRQRQRLQWGAMRTSYEVSFSSVRLARWFQDIGITPRKSRTLGALQVPGDYLVDTIRGLLDGDGSLARFTDGRGRHCFSVAFNSASRAHLVWLSDSIRREVGVRGSLSSRWIEGGVNRNPMHVLRYEASRLICGYLYRDDTAPRLERKWIRWGAELESGRIC